MASTESHYYGTGRRKSSIARVFLTQGTGEIVVNRRPLDQYFGRETAAALTSPYWYRFGSLLFKAGDYLRAQAAFRRALSGQPLEHRYRVYWLWARYPRLLGPIFGLLRAWLKAAKCGVGTKNPG